MLSLNQIFSSSLEFIIVIKFFTFVLHIRLSVIWYRFFHNYLQTPHLRQGTEAIAIATAKMIITDAIASGL
jgi:hypothetical protein